MGIHGCRRQTIDLPEVEYGPLVAVIATHQPSPPAIIDAGGSSTTIRVGGVSLWTVAVPHAPRVPASRKPFPTVVRHPGLLLHTIAPADVGQYLDGLPDAISSKKLYLAAIRHLFDILVTRHAVVLNPAARCAADATK